MKTVLLIEDDETNARLLKRVLGGLDSELVWVRNGVEGLQVALQRKPALIFVDLDLPDIDGKAVANRLRFLLKDVPMIAISLEETPTTRRLVRAFGCMGLISKPLDVRQLLELLQGVLKTPETTVLL